MIPGKTANNWVLVYSEIILSSVTLCYDYYDSVDMMFILHADSVKQIHLIIT